MTEELTYEMMEMMIKKAKQVYHIKQKAMETKADMQKYEGSKDRNYMLNELVEFILKQD